jgi:hypothetical protein
VKYDLRPLDRFSSIKTKLGLLVAVTIVVASVLAVIGTRLGISPWATVPVAVVVALAVTQLQWDHWWNRALLEADQADGADWPPDLSAWWTPPAFESLHAAPELQEIVAAHFFDAVRWSNDRHQEHGATMQRSVSGLFATKLVRGMERALARTARPFRLRITEIPVLGQHLWQLRPDHVLVSSALLLDTVQYHQQLIPVVEALS